MSDTPATRISVCPKPIVWSNWREMVPQKADLSSGTATTCVTIFVSVSKSSDTVFHCWILVEASSDPNSIITWLKGLSDFNTLYLRVKVVPVEVLSKLVTKESQICHSSFVVAPVNDNL